MRRTALLGATLAAGASLARGDADIAIEGGKFAMHWVRNISVPLKPGYSQLPPALPGMLVQTSFEATPFVGKHAVYTFDVTTPNAEMQQIPGTEAIDWPNAATGANSSVFGFPAVIVGSGFLVPSHTTGGIWVMEASATPKTLMAPVKITADKKEALPDSGWFYHEGEFVDMDGDGRLDILTSRAQFSVWPWGKKRGELLWLQQPAENPLNGEPWVEHHLADGPDFVYCIRPGPGPLALVATEFINERIVYYYMGANGTMEQRVLDSASGPAFSCTWEDLNGDGRMELLATNHVNQNGSVYAYTFDSDDPATAKIERHVLATGFSAVTKSQGTAAPGDAFAFQPKILEKGAPFTKPHIFVSGDNGNTIFMLVAQSERQDDWAYTKQELAFLGADIGRPSIGDVDGNGFADIFVPAYDSSVLVHYEITPASAPGTSGTSSTIVI